MASTSYTPFLSYNIPPPIFDGESYQVWSIQIKTPLKAQGLWEIIENEFINPTVEEKVAFDETKRKEYEKECENFDTKNTLALAFIYRALTPIIFPRIMVATMAHQAWKILKEAYRGSEKVITIKLQTLWKDFDTLLMKDDEIIQTFFGRVTTIVNQIQLYGDIIEDKKVVQKVLRCLPTKFDHIVAAIEESKDLSTLSQTELMGSLQAHEERMRRFSDQPPEQAFQAKLKFSNNGENKKSGHGRKKDGSNGRGRGRGNCKNQGSRDGGKSGSYCRLCKKDNHSTDDCRLKCRNCTWHVHHYRDCRNSKKGEVIFSEKDDSNENVFYSCLSTRQEPSDCWYVDSGCSNHMTGSKNSFVQLDENIKSNITLGDGRTQRVEGKGTIVVNARNGHTKHIQDVPYVPGLATNLLSVGQLMQRGYSVKFDDNTCLIIDKKKDQIMTSVAMAPNKIFPMKMPMQA